MVAIGGVGGSGTRLIAQFLNDLGYFIGHDLNEPNDNLLFTLLFKHQSILSIPDIEFDDILNIFIKIMSSEEPLTKVELRIIDKLVSRDRTLHKKEFLKNRLNFLDRRSTNNLWGWKEPNTHIVIEKLLKKMPDLKFIYVYRQGMDMAYSANQNQLKLWGKIFFNDYDMEINARNSLKYWLIAQNRMLKLQTIYPDKILMFDFDKMCDENQSEMNKLAEFLNDERLLSLSHLIKRPSSIGRYKDFPLSNFDADDINAVATLYDSTRLNV